MITITSFDGMANPIPSTETFEVALAKVILLDVIPITCPWILISGPPEFPGLIAVSV